VDDPRTVLEARLEAVERALAEIDGRLRALERGAAHSVGPVAEPQRPGPAAAVTVDADLVAFVSLVGRTFVIFAGAYLLRALTESGALDRATGVALGFAYAGAWTFIADRVAPRHVLSATFFGAGTVLIGYPLLWEATTRFSLLRPAASAVALAVMTGIVLLTAWRRALAGLAWLATTAACVLASVLLVATGQAVPFAAFLVALGVTTLWLGYDRDWTVLRWVAALFADAAVLGLLVRALATPPRDQPATVMAVQVLLLVGYLGSIVVRTLVRGRDVVPFEVVQSGAMLLVGLAPALLIAHRTGLGVFALGIALLVLAMACYAVEFIDRRRTRGANRYFYTSLALAFALTGSELLLDGPPLGIAWVALALIVGWTGHRHARSMLAVHSVVYIAAAAVASGLAGTTAAGLFGSSPLVVTPVGIATWVALIAIGVCWWLSAPGPTASSAWRADVLSRVALAALALVSVAGVSVVVVESVLPERFAAPPEFGALATLRTAVLAATAVAVAWLGRRLAAPEYRPLLYTVLSWGALKLLFEDVPTSSPLLLFVAFALYGGALIIGPRVAKFGAEPSDRRSVNGITR
jgi:hypothetical protein